MLKKILAFSLSALAISVLLFATFRQISNQRKVAGISTSNDQKQIRGIVLPHHNLAKEYITTSLERITQNQNVKTIVIIGPNHFQEEQTRFITTEEILDYPVLKDFIYKLKSADLVDFNKEIIENEHSITVPASYLEKYFPDTVYIPLIAPRFFDKSDISQIAVFLKAGLPEDTLYVASCDFAHEKMLLEAMENNKETENAIANFDYQKIYQFRDDHIDSPASLGLFLQIMQRSGTTNWETWHNSHGALIEDKPELQGTSYMIGVFTE